MTAARGVRPRVQLHRGTVVAEALWFDPALLGEREARQRVLAAWTPGAGVFRVAGGLLLRLPQPRAVACTRAPGLPLTLEGGVLTSAPLRPMELAQLATPPGTAVLVRAGRAEVHSLDGASRVDVSAWLDVSAWRCVEVKGLGAPPPPVAVLPPVEAPSRGQFGKDVPPLAPEAEVMLARMQGRPVPAQVAEAAAREGGGASAWLQRFMGWLFGGASASVPAAEAARTPVRAARAVRPSRLGRIFSWLRGLGPRPSEGAATGAPARASSALVRAGGVAVGAPFLLARMLGALLSALFGGMSSAGAGAAPSASSAPPRPAGPPPGPGLLSRLSEWALRNTPLGRLLGQRKADYVRRLFEMFEDGDLQEALRYAIPLGSGMTEQARVALGLPGPREALRINLQRGGGASTLFGSGEDVFNALKARYRAAFQRLEREGKIDEAAFVLAELLGAHEEAVSFLERHGRLRLAAELAESRGLPPGLVVRQWFLAKDVARAVAIARRSGAFADAVPRLERTHPVEARTLRLLWAETLAEAGDYALAVDVVWPVPEARTLARTWMERGAAAGGVSGARLLARLVLTFPEQFTATRARVRELLDDESRDRAVERATFAQALSAEPTSDVRTALAAPTVRALLRDKAAGFSRPASSILSALLRDAGHGALRADLPPGAERETAGGSTPWASVLVERLSPEEAGAFAVHDAVALPDGRLLVALGEAGARLLRWDGGTLAHFDVPAFALVVSVHGDRALALAPRGELHRVSRLDLGTRRATAWCDARVDTWASGFDGNLWFVADGGTVMAVDAFAADWRALWRVPQVGECVRALAVDAERLGVFATTGEAAEAWSYALANGPVLRSRQPVKNEGSFEHPALLPDGRVEFGEGVARVPAWRARCVREEGSTEVCLFSSQPGQPLRARVLFDGWWVTVRARFSAGELVAFDGTGRVVRVDLAAGTARRLRVL